MLFQVHLIFLFKLSIFFPVFKHDSAKIKQIIYLTFTLKLLKFRQICRVYCHLTVATFAIV